jgi:hypothetical protein
MLRLTWWSILVSAAISLSFTSQTTLASGHRPGEQPWEKYGVNLGVFVASTDSTFRIGSGIGLDIDVENLLGLDATNTVFRTGALWRFSDNRRHRLDFNWFSFKRDGTRQILDDITIENKAGEKITIEAGSTVNGFFDLDIYEVAYSYSFFQDERIDLAAGIGFYVMPIDFGLRVTGIADEEGSQDFTAPLPVVGLRMDFALTPQWFIRTGSQLFYLEYDSFKGVLMDFRAAIEYNPWKHVGIGLGFDTMAIKLEADGEDFPGIDFTGRVRFNYTGLQLYLRWFY